jgi:NAD(P)-dependent dehydrogenase (short-subunit alcohol dehydrogenase family)
MQDVLDPHSELGIDAEDLETCLRVLEQLDELPVDHPHAEVVQRATGRLYKQFRQRRKLEKRAAELAADHAVLAATATGAPGRIDDETAGIPLAPRTQRPRAGTLLRARGCYICKRRYTEVDAFYHQLCPECASFSHARRDARTDLTGRRALLTGGRAKIGMYIALLLLRDGAHTTITTRFPRDAARRFAQLPDSDAWIHRLQIVGVDLRNPAQVVALADRVSEQGPLDILINNACQTVRRSANAYAPLIDAESAPLPQIDLPEIVELGAVTASSAAQLGPGDGNDALLATTPHWAPTPHALSALALTARSASFDRIETGTAIDAGGLVPDLVDTNSWVQNVEHVDPLELLEVQLCNQTAPFILISRLRGALAASNAHRKYVVNVSAMEGQFSRGYKGPGHPHTNMSKAALNMLTRTSAQEMFERDRILMTAVDTGWITDERPHTTKQRLAETGFHAPLDLVDGAARVYDPIVQGESGNDLYGCFLKDYRVSDW